MARFSDLPEEILVEIWSWLPPESLIQFKCVKKSWYPLITALIKKPAFVAKHLYNGKFMTPSLIYNCGNSEFISSSLLYKYNDESNYRLGHAGFLTICNNGGNGEYLSCGIEDFKAQIVKHIENFCFVGSSCNGIVCLVDYSQGNILLCNPAIREFKILPDPCLYYMKYRPLIRVGFGYDPITNVYKVVRVFGWIDGFTAQVYTLGNNSWRDINYLQTKTRHQSIRRTIKAVYSKGVYYWLLRASNYEEIVHSFDMHDEKFHIIPLPDNCQESEFISNYNTSLTQWNELVVLFCYPKIERLITKPIEMWVMRDSSVDRPCWTKHRSIDPLGGIHKTPIAFWKSDELLLREDEKRLVSYNLLTGKFKSIHEEVQITSFYAFPHVKSLVSVNISETLPTQPLGNLGNCLRPPISIQPPVFGCWKY